jgi:hypothetical protein
MSITNATTTVLSPMYLNRLAYPMTRAMGAVRRSRAVTSYSSVRAASACTASRVSRP